MGVLEPKIVDFVVVLDQTAGMIDHWDSIMKSYIRPALEYFNGKASTAMDYIGNNGNSHYGYVLLHSNDSSLEPMTTSAVIQSPSLFLRKLDSIAFSGGCSGGRCFVAEGLGRALKIFEDISIKRNQRDSMKICILVSASPPYDIPCYDTREHFGKSYEDLVKAMGSMSIHLSVISPRHIKQMKDMYRLANQPKSALMNYAQDLRHLVLISGFELPIEQTPVKVEQKREPVTSSSQQAIQVPSSVSSPSIATSIVPSTFTSRTNTGTLSSQTNYPSPRPPSQLPSIGKQTVKQEPQPSMSVVPNSTPFNQVTSFQDQDKKPTQTFSSTNSGVGSSPFSVPPQVTPPRPQMPAPPKPAPVLPVPVSAVSQPTPAMEAAKRAMEAAIQQQQKPAWTGLLEWTEKRAGATGVEERTSHQLNCEIVVSRNTTEENIGNCWPEKLVMQLVPRIVLTNEVVKPYLANVPVLNLKLSPHDQSVQLCNLMSQRWMGVINVMISPSGMPPQGGDSRVILVIYSPTPQNAPPARGNVFPPGGRTVPVPSQTHFRPNISGRMNEMSGMQGRQMEFVQTSQVNNPGQQVPQPNVVVSQNPGNPQPRYSPIIRHPQTMPRLPQQHPRMRAVHQQPQQPQITLNRPNHANDNVRALLGNNNASQGMNQQQRPGMVNTGMGQPNNMGYMQNQQMRHTIGSRVMNMPQQRFGMQ